MPLTGVSSMASRQVLTALAEQWRVISGQSLSLIAAGGIDVAKRIRAGEEFDLVFLANDALTSLQDEGFLLTGSLRPLMRSGIALAVRDGDALPDISSEEALRSTVLAAPSIGYSTGPSGSALLALFQRWGVVDTLKDRLVQAPAGVPVGQLVAQGKVAIGFQQRSEPMGLAGITLVASLPDTVQIDTVFSGAIARSCRDVERQAQATAVLEFMASAKAGPVITHYGMKPA